MPADKNFKHLVRERMRRTGESYTTARAQLARRFGRESSAPQSVRERAAAELKRKFDLLQDAVDDALAAGLTWNDIAERLRLDPRILKRWFDDGVVTD